MRYGHYHATKYHKLNKLKHVPFILNYKSEILELKYMHFQVTFPFCNVKIPIPYMKYYWKLTILTYLWLKDQTRGSQEPVIAHQVFNLTSIKLIENGGVTHNFESGPPKDHFNLKFLSKRFWCNFYLIIFLNGINWLKKISQKNPEYMLNYSLPCSCS